MISSPALDQLAAALCLAQADIEGAQKNASNPFFKSRYSDLASCWAAARGPLTAHGLSIVQSPSAEGAVVTMETMLLHASGQWIRGSMRAVARDDSPQALISICTYLRRLGVCAFASVCPLDDDAEAAQSHTPVVAAPAGFEAWIDNLTDVADSGSAALKKAWSKSDKVTVECRAYLTTQQPDRWTNLKMSAAAISADDGA